MNLQAKIQKFQEGVRRWQSEGKNLAPVQKILEELQPLMAQGKHPEADAVLDRALEIIEGKK